MNAVHYFLIFFVAVDLPLTILLFGFYSPDWFFHPDLIAEQYAFVSYTSSPLDFVVLALLRAALLMALCFHLWYSDRIINIKMPSLGVATAIYSHTLVKLLCFSEHPEMLLYPGVWMTLTWSILAAAVFFVLCCQLTAPRLFEYGRLDETERNLSSGSQPRESTWRLVRLLFGYCRAQWKWFTLGFIFLMLYALSRVFIPAFTGRVLADITLGGGMAALVRSVILMSLLALSSTIFGGLRGGTFTYASALVSRQIKLDLFRSLVKQEIAFFDTTKSGETVSRLSSDCQVMASNVSTHVNVFLRNFVMCTGSLCVMLYMSWRLTMVTLIAVPFTGFITKWYGSYYDKLSEETQTTIAKANNKAEEVLGSMRTVRSFACEMFEAKAFEEDLDVTLKVNRKKSLAYMGYTWNNEFNQNGVLIAVLCYGGHLVMTDNLTAASLLTFLLYQIQLGENVYWLGFVIAGIMDCVGSSRKVFEYMHRKPAMPFDGDQRPIVQGTICFEDVYFTYPSRPNNPVLKGLNLTIKAGTTVALVGPSGGGKSSIVSLIQHMYEPDSGSITIDGIPIQNVDHEYYHERVALVAQEPILYNGTVRENILYGCDWATEEDMLEAARKANVHNFVMELEKDYDTQCGDRGVQMSGGQKQRIAIARAMVRNPCVLILDEATSALDAESEAQVQEAINRCAGKRTVLIVAHRLSTVERADAIAVIQKGSLVQIGTHESLMEETDGLYYSLISKQLLAPID
ncbi:antigen peptide transporter 2 [Ancylostoma caninum]|uniref:Antigen peptide transporter 2 n=1 Tax=Ancylostoma caninum TaxID=29170 RepID=A0A368GR44_ANCCA|nr:antigen peptide transporter 2 [Ancylostoma caninum]